MAEYKATFYCDSRLLDGQGKVHGWVEFKIDGNITKVYSLSPDKKQGTFISAPGIYDEIDSDYISDTRKSVCDSFEINLDSEDQYNRMTAKGDEFVKHSKDPSAYSLGGEGGADEKNYYNHNCITVSREILREGNIHILDGCISPQAAAGRIKIANELRNNEENWNDYFKDSTNRTNSDYNSWLDWFNQNQPRMDEGSFDASWFTGFGDFLASLNEGDVPLPPNLSPAALNAVLSANKRLNELNGNMAYGRKDPIAVDLDWDGVETVSFKEGVNFDLNKDGIKEKTGWIAADDGLLVMDRDDNGTIDNGGELFGDQTPLKDGSIAATGYQALDELDTNKDGYITKEDTDFDKLQVWQDHNQDGVSQYDELYSLTDAGISKINLDYKTGAGEDEQENIQTRIASFEFTDGNIGTTAEYLFSTNNIDTENSDFSNVSDEVKALPYLRGFGLVTDLHHAMANDAALKQMVEEFVNFGNTLTTEGTKNTEANNNQPSTINGILNAKFEAA